MINVQTVEQNYLKKDLVQYVHSVEAKYTNIMAT